MLNHEFLVQLTFCEPIGTVAGSKGRIALDPFSVALSAAWENIKRGNLSYIINPRRIGMCSTVACISHFARVLVFADAAHKQTCRLAVLVTDSVERNTECR